MPGRELRRIAKRAPLTLRLMLRAFNPHAREDSHGVTEAQRRFTAGALPQTPKAGQSQAIDWRQIIFYTLHGQTYDLKIEPPMLCDSVRDSFTCMWLARARRKRNGREAPFASRRSSGIVGRGSKMGKLQRKSRLCAASGCDKLLLHNGSRAICRAANGRVWRPRPAAMGTQREGTKR